MGKLTGGQCTKKRNPNPGGRLDGLTKVLKRIKKAESKGLSPGYIAGLEAKAARLRRKEK